MSNSDAYVKQLEKQYEIANIQLQELHTFFRELFKSSNVRKLEGQPDVFVVEATVANNIDFHVHPNQTTIYNDIKMLYEQQTNNKEQETTGVSANTKF